MTTRRGPISWAVDCKKRTLSLWCSVNVRVSLDFSSSVSSGLSHPRSDLAFPNGADATICEQLGPMWQDSRSPSAVRMARVSKGRIVQFGQGPWKFMIMQPLYS
jgi:hypothetical protein